MTKRASIKTAALIALIAVLCYNAALTVLQNTNEQIFSNVTVVDKARVSYGYVVLNTHKYLIYTMDAEGGVRVFENTDTIFHQKFDSSDFYARIHIGDTYTFRVVGRRLPHFSRYKNIIEILETADEKQYGIQKR